MRGGQARRAEPDRLQAAAHRLRAAEERFLSDCGWRPQTVLFAGQTVKVWVDPHDGSQRARWAAVQRQRSELRVD